MPLAGSSRRTLHRRQLGAVAKLPPMTVAWKRLAGPYFGNGEVLGA
jgi:hypothetical protein